MQAPPPAVLPESPAGPAEDSILLHLLGHRTELHLLHHRQLRPARLHHGRCIYPYHPSTYIHTYVYISDTGSLSIPIPHSKFTYIHLDRCGSAGDDDEKGLQRAAVDISEWTQNELPRLGWHRPRLLGNPL